MDQHNNVMWREYFIPDSLERTLALLAERQGEARLIAGGTDLVVEFDRKLRSPCALIDISRLPGLDFIRRDDAGWIHLGPLVTHNDVVASDLCIAQALPLAQACRQVGAPQIRNRGTVAGNLVTGSPANDTITALMALDARVTLRSLQGERSIALADFYTGVRRTVMRPDEMLVEIAFRALRPNQRGAFLKLGLRQAQAIAVVNCAVVLTMDAEGRIEDARIALGAVAPVIIRAREAEQRLIGRAPDEATIQQAAELAAQATQPIDDIRGSAAYRRDATAVLVRRALRQATDAPAGAAWSEPPALLRLVRHDGGAAFGADGHDPVSVIRTTVNGREYVIGDADAREKTLLRLLREDCGLIGVKEGCSEGECGACTVILDGRAVMACLTPAPRAHGATIVTIEGVGALGQAPARDDGLHPLQRAFIEAGAVQCGYCTPGFIMSGAALLCEHPRPSDAQIKESISGNLCRCTGYYKIIEAFRRVRDEGERTSA
ncbi:MAG: FAD binding domain-containing protein [Thermoflexales bacterium]|nr:FAD binding domain-containing protein [Thermoflexales bacterium]MDW8351974.1 FAD binding domain-containing protein [Anaerolineae bacterium]